VVQTNREGKRCIDKGFETAVFSRRHAVTNQ